MDHLQRWSRIFRSERTEIAFSIWLLTEISGTFGIMKSTHGAIHSTKISSNFGLKLNGSVPSNRKSFEKVSPPFEVDHFSRLDWSDRKFEHSDSFSIPVPRCSVFSIYNMGENTCHCSFWIFNSGSIGVTRTSMCTYNRSVAASQAKCMFWLFKNGLFPERIWNVLFVIRKWCLNSYGK